MSANMIKIAMPIPEDATMVSVSGISVDESGDIKTITKEYEYEEIQEMKREYLDYISTPEESTFSNVINTILIILTFFVTLALIGVLVMFFVLHMYPDSSLGLWFDHFLATFYKRIEGASSIFSHRFF